MGLRAEIYDSPHGNCSNDGISAHLRTVTVVNADGPFEPTEDAPAVRLVERTIFGRKVVHAEPVEKPEGMIGPMMGGAYIATSDSRFGKATGFYGAVALHDRYETAEQYEALSR